MEGNRERLLFDLTFALQRAPVRKPRRLREDEAAIYARHLADKLPHRKSAPDLSPGRLLRGPWLRTAG